MDNRRRQYVPLYVYNAHGKTGTRLKAELGAHGLLAWIEFLAACKREHPQGQLEYATEDEAWGKLGMADVRPEWPIDRLWTLTGRLHKTSRRTSGEVTTVVCRVWNEWEQNVEREHAADRMRRKRAQNTRDNVRTKREHYPNEDSTEGEGEEPPLGKASPSPSPQGESPPTRRSARKASAATAGTTTNTPKATGWRYTRNVRAEHWIRDPEGTDKPPRHIVQSWNEAEDRRQAAEHEQPNTDELPPVDPQAATKIRELAAQALPKNTR